MDSTTTSSNNNNKTRGLLSDEAHDPTEQQQQQQQQRERPTSAAAAAVPTERTNCNKSIATLKRTSLLLNEEREKEQLKQQRQPAPWWKWRKLKKIAAAAAADDDDGLFKDNAFSYHQTTARRRLCGGPAFLRGAAAPALVLAVAVGALATLAARTSPRRWKFRGNVQATLLSVHDGAYYLSALDNALYDDCLRGTFHNNNNNNSDGDVEIALQATPATLRPRGNLTLRWTGPVFDQDVLILLCHDDGDGGDGDAGNLTAVTDPALILEAATLGHARTTSWNNGGSALLRTTSSDDGWFLPRFPALRHDACRFVLYRKVRTAFYKLAHSNAVALQQHRATPAGVHLAYTGDASAVTVHFQTGSLPNAQPVVRYRESCYSEDWTYYVYGGTTATYTHRDLCQAPANERAPGKFSDPGALHAVAMDNLQAGGAYTYQVGLQVYSNGNDDDNMNNNNDNDDDENNNSNIVWSEQVYEFTAAREPGDSSGGPFSYIVYGDQGCPRQGCWTQGRAWMEGLMHRSKKSGSYPIAMLHHFGDLSYALGAAHQWDAWLDMMEVAAAYVPLMIAVGNHEYCYATSGVDDDASFRDPSGLREAPFRPDWGNFHDDSKGECGIPTAARFTMPATGNGIFWYSHDYGLVHTTVLSSEHNMTAGSPQYQWLEQDLAATDRSVTPFLVVETHRPLYNCESSYPGDNDVGIAMRAAIEDLLFQYQVDLVLAGHYHAYLRTCDQLYRGKCGVAGAPMHVTIGTAGVGLDYGTGLYPNVWTERFINTEYGHGRITVYNATALQLEFVRAGGVDEEGAGETLDRVWLLRDR